RVRLSTGTVEYPGPFAGDSCYNTSVAAPGSPQVREAVPRPATRVFAARRTVPNPGKAGIAEEGLSSMSQSPILVTGAAGRLGGVGGEVVTILRGKGLPVRALVRTDDDRAEALRATGTEVVVGDLTRAEDVARALGGCRRMYFGMSVSAP